MYIQIFYNQQYLQVQYNIAKLLTTACTAPLYVTDQQMNASFHCLTFVYGYIIKE